MELGEKLLNDIKESLKSLHDKVREFTGEEKSIKKSPLSVFTTSVDDLSEAVKKLTEAQADQPGEKTIQSLDKSVDSLSRILKDYGKHVSTHKKSLDDHIKALKGATGDEDDGGGGTKTRTLTGATREGGFTSSIIKGTLLTSIIIGAFKKLMSPIMAPIRAIKGSGLLYPAMFFALFGDVLEEGFEGIIDRLRTITFSGESWSNEILGTGIFATGWFTNIPWVKNLGLLVMFFNQIGAIMSSDAIPWWIKTMVGFATFFATKSVVTGAFSLLKTLFYTWPLKIITFFGAGGTFRIAMTAIFAWASRMGGHLVTFFGKGGTLRNAIMAFFTWIKTPFLAGSALRRAFTSLVGLVTRLFAGVIAAVTTSIGLLLSAIGAIVAGFGVYYYKARQLVDALFGAEENRQGVVDKGFELRNAERRKKLRDFPSLSAYLPEIEQLEDDKARMRKLLERQSEQKQREGSSYWERYKSIVGGADVGEDLTPAEEIILKQLQEKEGPRERRLNELLRTSGLISDEPTHDIHKSMVVDPNILTRNIAQTLLSPNIAPTEKVLYDDLISREYKEGTLEALNGMVTQLQSSSKSFDTQTALLIKFLQENRPGTTNVIQVQSGSDPADDHAVPDKY